MNRLQIYRGHVLCWMDERYTLYAHEHTSYSSNIKALTWYAIRRLPALVHWVPELTLKIPNQSSRKLFEMNRLQTYRGHIFMLDGWEVHFICTREYLLFIQHKSLEMICSPEVTIFDSLGTKISSKNFKSVQSKLFEMNRLQSRRGHIFMLNGWEVHFVCNHLPLSKTHH